MTYSPGSSGYPQSPGSYGASTPSFAKSDDTAGKPQPYLAGVVVVLGLLAYLVSFGKMYTTMLPGGEELIQTGGGFPVAATLLAALLAAAGLLPKAKNYAPVVAAISALGALMLIENAIGASGRAWALWVVLGCSVLQAIAASWVLLLDEGVITPSAPRPKYDQYSQYGQYGGYGGYYGQQQHAPYQQHSPQQSGYGSQYGGYSSSPSTGGFGAMAPQTGPQQQSQSGPQQGLSTPPTGFPSYSPPPSSGGSGSAAQGQNHGDSGGQGGQTHDTQGQGQGQQSSSAGPAQS